MFLLFRIDVKTLIDAKVKLFYEYSKSLKLFLCKGMNILNLEGLLGLAGKPASLSGPRYDVLGLQTLFEK